MTKPNLGEIEEMSETFIVQIIMALFVCLFLYMLYISGFLLFNMKIADFFIGYIKRDGSVSLNFEGCKGKVSRIIRFKESREYVFTYHSEVTEGVVTVKFLDKQKQEIISCSTSDHQIKIKIDKKNTYRLIFNFSNATGKCTVVWK